MALPPEQINIKRRREEEPVETLYIQSALHQTKRRFTDFVFHRVTLKASESSDTSPSPPSTAHPAAQRLLRSPRSVSSLHVSRRAPASSNGNGNVVPTVRATSPGAEFREVQRLAAARKELEEKRRQLIYSGQAPPSPSQTSPASAPAPISGSVSGSGSRPSTPDAAAKGETKQSSRTASPSRAQSLRRFQISRSNLGSLRSPGGIQKRRADGPAPGVAVLVEQLHRRTHSRKTSMVSDMVAQAQLGDRVISLPPKEVVEGSAPASPVKPRKRPVVNQAERRWREERKGSISAAKNRLSETLEKSAQQTQQRNWDEESERLARDFEQVALELQVDDGNDGDEQKHVMDLDTRIAGNGNVSAVQPVSSTRKPPLKYQPRQPKEPRIAPVQSQSGSQSPLKNEEAVDDMPEAEDDDGDYVYDVYIRRPLSESEMLRNPLSEYESEQQQKNATKAQSGVGVIVITEEDEQYWEHFVEDDEEEWDSEDADSNAENNPANDYPDEEISSDDDGFDFDDSASEDGFNSGFGYNSRYGGQGSDSDDY
ncbi:hypothetical protein N7499_000390 [Penicillium canescens]|uniref:Transcription factor Iwr1 domain-containing protein n=1 Tax=Penicillium canescens TaxID=5083 RepID=A0AAD6NB21_PENCN|nr:uncharacterized protein N7446_011410 [Penicillium canescens]KAJ6029245.1 hypothetical protein N7444_012232 [Penicillium canescens]KAJ6047675.1 hypothetical protein N7460_003822 [Penicillium canescens]KAJ6048727.1 hypothetical protein N7446_011410 [Penicillium canescens]KAJ6100760.1 hypothetical protein N7499_000390 [Penicillium canescens]KAJ6173222.1 hypothetical protein N7485_006034 [Penicillium canescens]